MPYLNPPKGPCTPVRRPQTRSPGLPGGKDITVEAQMKILYHVRPSSAAFCRKYAVQCSPSRPIDTVRSKLQKTVNRALCRCELAHFRAPIAPSAQWQCASLCVPVKRTNLAPLEPRPTTVTGRLYTLVITHLTATHVTAISLPYTVQGSGLLRVGLKRKAKGYPSLSSDSVETL
jgi:hypothetical protein